MLPIALFYWQKDGCAASIDIIPLEKVPLLEQGLNKLEYGVDELIRICDKLRQENNALRKRGQHLAQEQARLQEINRQAGVRLEKIVGKLNELSQAE